MQKFDKKHLALSLALIAIATMILVIAKPKQISQLANYQPPTPPPPTITTLFLAGDIMLSRNVAGEIIKAKDNTLPFLRVGDKIRAADIAFANLESPFLDKPPYAQQGLVFKADPKAIQGLLFAGFDILSTANNHAFDQGRDGITYTIDWLKQNNILHVGSGIDCHGGRVIEKNDIKFGFLAYSYTALNDGGKTTDPLVCDWNNAKQIATDVATLKAKTDFVIVSGQFGIEYQRRPEEGNVTIARAAIDAGADLVIGHHPHWIQTIEQYKGKWILYSVGNFVFDQMWSEDTKQGMTAFLEFKDKQLSKITLEPVIIENYCCPRWANPDETGAILNKINLTDQVLMNNN